MLRVCAYKFLNDESGAGTIMGLLWFILIVGLTGMAVDITDGLRTKTGLQATVDAAALAAVMDLPNEATARATAVTYAGFNMSDALHGDVLRMQDVEFGVWDEDTRTFNAGETPALAARLLVGRNTTNANALPANFLRIIGLQSWNVAAAAVAERFVPRCLRDGLLAEGIVDITSNNGFVNEICIHGEQGVEMQNHNFFELGTTVSMPDPAYMLTLPSGGMESNVGLNVALKGQSRQMRMISDLPNIIAKLKDPSLDTDYPSVIPSYIDTSLPVIVVDDKFDFNGLNLPEGSGRIYHIQCERNRTASIPSGSIIRNVVIVADCKIHAGSGVNLRNVVLASSAVNTTPGANKPQDRVNIDFASSAILGKPDSCSPGGGVQIFSLASVKTSSSTQINGVQIVAAGDIDLGAQANGINGISAQAGGDITMSANNEFGLCSGGAPNLFTVGYYHLVR